jgi:hypothetical protein
MGRPKGSKNRSKQINQVETDKMCFKSFQQSKSPSKMFGDMINLTKMVAAGVSPSLLVTGMPGLGKTYTITRTLESQGYQEGIDFIHVKGRSTAAGLYITLYENSDKMIIFDDCDSIFKDSDAINLLKGALDSYEKRIISWISAKPLKDSEGEPLPRYFEFTGRVIFISNLHITRVDDAIRSRAFTQDITLTVSQMIERMTELLPHIEPKIKDMQIKQDALNALKKAHAQYDGVELNFRSLIKAIRIRQMGFEGWEDMIAEQVMGVA